jgi:hypothetical protein
VGRTGEHRFDEVLEGRLARFPEEEADGRECRFSNPEGTMLIDARFSSRIDDSSFANACFSLAAVTSRNKSSVIQLFRNVFVVHTFVLSWA